ncbi:LacI family DNA-binding transcriptional regulator [Kribbella sp. NPDC050124]|uniref:LacI family DNA-binding transcriptional regulator n=1 Tax=Kribbella sp. NPDC050124 TaxID=3364114 RepID=UPI0037A7B6EB
MTARMRDVAERAGVSVKTVSNVINDYPHVTPATRARVEAAIADLDYRPNLGARSLRKGTYGVIALALPDLADEYFATLAAAVARAAKKRDVALLIEQTDGDPTAESQALTGLRHRPADAILLWPTHPTLQPHPPTAPTAPASHASPASPADTTSRGRRASTARTGDADSPGSHASTALPGDADSPGSHASTVRPAGADPSSDRPVVLLGSARPELLLDRITAATSGPPADNEALAERPADHRALTEQQALVEPQALAEQAVCLALERLADRTTPSPRRVAIRRGETAGS